MLKWWNSFPVLSAAVSTTIVLNVSDAFLFQTEAGIRSVIIRAAEETMGSTLKECFASGAHRGECVGNALLVLNDNYNSQRVGLSNGNQRLDMW